MSETLRWWLALQLIALPLTPLCLLMLRRLPDRGYALAKPFGLLLLGFTLWFLNSTIRMPNDRVGILASLALLAAVSAWLTYRYRDDLADWADSWWRYVVAVEAILFATLAFAVWLRSFHGIIEHTEQPMDLMFLNAASRADHFPPQDPWLSGHTVAYYYFGYLIVAIVGKLSALPTDVSYNIGLAMIASLTFTGATGLVFNLVRMRSDSTAGEPAPGRVDGPRDWGPLAYGVAGAALLVLLGNLVFLVEFLSGHGVGGQGFYEWLHISGVTADERLGGGWYPKDFFAFFDASRVYQLNSSDYVITEFPMFSFVLGDMHPHVMALPFVLVAVGLALTLYRSDEPLDLTFWLKRPLLLLGSAVVVGGLAFINTWDIATFSFVIVAAAALHNYMGMPRAPAAPDDPPPSWRPAAEWLPAFAVSAGGYAALVGTLVAAAAPEPSKVVWLCLASVALLAVWALYLARSRWPGAVELLANTATFAVPLVLLAVDLYTPFYRSFSSQASGLLPVAATDVVTVPGTRPIQLLIFWGPLLAVVIPFVLLRLWELRARLERPAIIAAAAVPVAVVVGWAFLFALVKAVDVADARGADGFGAQISERGSGWVTAVALGALVWAALLALWLELTGDDAEPRRPRVFALMLIAIALLLILGTEFFYVGDVFNSRMNTVFKLYYESWVLLALAAGLALFEVVDGLRRIRAAPAIDARFHLGWAAVVAIVLAAGALYPLGATFNRTDAFDRPRQMHGLAALPPADQEAIRWLIRNTRDQEFVIAEAVGGDYWVGGQFSRVSAGTGLPVILGWGGHEDQWRGTVAPRAGRFEDLAALYQAGDLAESLRIAEKYDVTYIYVGDLERSTYGAQAMEKFSTLPVAYDAGGVTIYAAGLARGGEAAP